MIARRLSQTRRFSVDTAYRHKANPEKDRRRTSVGVNNNNSFSRQLSAPASAPEYPTQHPNPEEMYPDKIKAWLNRSLDALSVTVEEQHEKDQIFELEPEDKNHQSINKGTRCSVSSSEGSTSSHPSFSRLPTLLQNELNQTTSTLIDVSWDITKSDLFIETEDTLFPVEKNFIAYVSEKFQSLIEESTSIQIGGSVFLVLNQYTTNEIKTVLAYIHASDDTPITDQNVASYLQLGDEFKVPRLIYQCEKYLRSSKTFNPVITSHLAKQYQLDALLEFSYSEISKIDDIEDSQEFQLLDSTAQNQILKYIVKRYKKASKTLSQFDVHLCNHHGVDPKNNQCCFRAATYSTENNRIFLVRMEKPEERLLSKFQTALMCDSEKLISSDTNKTTYNSKFHSV
ncbi:uncharacterized protein [Clytia hemisphaerica]|uniref:uncharacterized protein isoform X3 n=1 Tax=Clytia hemisphaerica TaxID=252671 RepID=UPI0034D60C1C